MSFRFRKEPRKDNPYDLFPEPTSEEQQRQLDQAIAEAQQEDLERDQAMEQWLRRVPDDPSGLLRQKFRYESRQRQQQGKTKDDDTYW